MYKCKEVTGNGYIGTSVRHPMRVSIMQQKLLHFSTKPTALLLQLAIWCGKV